MTHTIVAHKLFLPESKVCVAVSGGKDSCIALLLTKKICPKVSAIAVDEGIRGYRSHTLKFLKVFCSNNKIPLRIVSFKEEFGKTLDELIRLLPSIKPCTLCGILRRYALNKAANDLNSSVGLKTAAGFDCIITGHNLDDEAQSILMNLFYSNPELLSKLGPKTGLGSVAFVQRVKPLYFCSEKETLAYSYLVGLNVPFIQCPYSEQGLRAFVRDELNLLESKSFGRKKALIDNFVAFLPTLKVRYSASSSGIGVNSCSSCGEPAKHQICNACKILESIRYCSSKTAPK